MPGNPPSPLRKLRPDAGIAAIEFAVMAPLLLALILSIIELGLATRDSMRAQSAAATGAYYAMQKGFNATNISSAVVNGTGAVGLSASPAPTLFCGCPTTTGISTATCGAICTGGIPARQYVKVNASISRTSILNAHLGLPSTITRQSIVRLP